ncbi:hypothetical protein BRD17_01005, partial [Halobacteriales archaeon SW_7_68_16]
MWQADVAPLANSAVGLGCPDSTESAPDNILPPISAGEIAHADIRHEPRDAVERAFVESLRRTLHEGGTVVVPAFGIGRTQEILLICAAAGITPYVDGMGKRVTDLFRRHAAFVRNEEALARAAGNAREVTSHGQRERIADRSTVIVTTSGMLQGGPAMTYVPAIRSHPVNKIAFTGYQVAGTPGRELIETGRAEIDGQVIPVSAQVEQYDFSAHADRDGLRDLLSTYRDTQVLVNHGDDCEGFAADLRGDEYEATAPERGETVVL